MASVVHPFFKRNHVMSLFPFMDFNEIQTEIIQRMEKMTEDQSCPQNALLEQSQSGKQIHRLQGFFGSTISDNNNSLSQNMSDLTIFHSFLDDTSNELSIFNNPKYAKLREIFIDLNTKIPSSASVERLFSTAKKFWTYDRPNLSDKRLEQMIFLKSNRDLF